MLITDNAFYVLGVSPEDNKTTIIEKCEEKIFNDDDENIDYQLFQNALLNPAKRLYHEIHWFLGTDIKLMDKLLDNPEAYAGYIAKVELPLSKLNLKLYAIHADNNMDLEETIWFLDQTYRELKYQHIMEKINESRIKAGITVVQDKKLVIAELRKLRDDIRTAIVAELKKIDFSFYQKLVQDIVKKISASEIIGQQGAVINDFLALYKLDSTSYILKLYELAKLSLERYKSTMGEDALYQLHASLEELLYAEKPIYFFNKWNGVPQELYGTEIYIAMRRFYVTLYNEQKDETHVSEIINVIMQVYKDFSELYEQTREDLAAIEKNKREGNQVLIREQQYNRDIENLDDIGDLLFVEGHFEAGYSKENLDLYNNDFKSYEQVIDKILSRGYTGEARAEVSKKVIIIYMAMSNIITWTEDFALAKGLIAKAEPYVKYCEDEEVLEKFYENKKRIEKSLGYIVHDGMENKDAEKLINNPESKKRYGWLWGVLIIVVIIIGIVIKFV